MLNFKNLCVVMREKMLKTQTTFLNSSFQCILLMFCEELVS